MNQSGESVLVQALQFEPNIRAELTRRLALPVEELDELLQETHARILSLTHQSSLSLAGVKALVFETLNKVLADRRLLGDKDTPSISKDPTGLAASTRDDEPSSNEEVAQVVHAVQTLPSLTRRTFTLRKVYGYSHQQIAERLGISATEVEEHLKSAAKVCGKVLFGTPPSEQFGGARRRRWKKRHW